MEFHVQKKVIKSNNMKLVMKSFAFIRKNDKQAGEFVVHKVFMKIIRIETLPLSGQKFLIGPKYISNEGIL